MQLLQRTKLVIIQRISRNAYIDFSYCLLYAIKIDCRLTIKLLIDNKPFGGLLRVCFLLRWIHNLIFLFLATLLLAFRFLRYLYYSFMSPITRSCNSCLLL